MRYLLFSLVILSLVFSVVVFAQEANLPGPGLTPDSSFYFLKTWKESIQTFFTFGEENKAKHFLHLSEVRLAEYQKMIEKGKTKIAEKTLRKYENQLQRALDKVQELKEKGKDAATLTDLISEKSVKHQEVLKIQRAIESSQKEKPELEAIEEKPKAQPKSTRAIQSKPTPTPNTSLPWVTGTPRLEFPSIYLTGQPIMMRPPGSPVPQPVAEQRPTLQPMADDEWCAKKRMIVSEPTEQGRKTILEMLGVETVKVGSVDCRACHIRKFSEGGVLVAERWDDMYLWYLQKLSGKWACEKSINYKNFIGSEWTDYYQISESWSPKNFYYQCVKKEGVYVSGNVDYCEKDVPASAILPSPAVTSPIPVSSNASCQKGKMEDYKCPNGSLIKWQCQCRYDESNGEEWRNCTVNPAESCFLSSSPSLTINSIRTKYDTWEQGRPGEPKSISMQIFWETNKPATSWIEYGLTTAYGSKVPSFAPTPDYYKHGTYDLPGMQYNTTYHFRIVAEDSSGNKVVSDDYTFTTGL